ncbi:MAG: hypothetical protein FJ398_22350 [Verrucomicrobia bacterium]|nr:hypothetical protein [Verrucomicrobiota bacterium]
MLASTSVDREIRFWRVEIEPEENVWARRGTPIGFSADRRTLITLATNQTGNLMSLAFSPDGKLLAGGYRDTAWVWEVATGETRAVLKTRNANGLGHVAFSLDGKTLITSGADGRVELWNIASGRVVLTVKSPLNLATRAFFSPDGNSLVVASRVPVPRPFVQILQPGSLAEIDATIRER